MTMTVVSTLDSTIMVMMIVAAIMIMTVSITPDMAKYLAMVDTDTVMVTIFMLTTIVDTTTQARCAQESIPQPTRNAQKVSSGTVKNVSVLTNACASAMITTILADQYGRKITAAPTASVSTDRASAPRRSATT